MWIGGAFPWRTNKAVDNPIVGSVWTQAGAFFGSRVTAIGVSPLNSDRVYFGTGSGGASPHAQRQGLDDRERVHGYQRHGMDLEQAARRQPT